MTWNDITAVSTPASELGDIFAAHEPDPEIERLEAEIRAERRKLQALKAGNTSAFTARNAARLDTFGGLDR